MTSNRLRIRNIVFVESFRIVDVDIITTSFCHRRRNLSQGNFNHTFPARNDTSMTRRIGVDDRKNRSTPTLKLAESRPSTWKWHLMDVDVVIISVWIWYFAIPRYSNAIAPDAPHLCKKTTSTSTSSRSSWRKSLRKCDTDSYVMCPHTTMCLQQDSRSIKT